MICTKPSLMQYYLFQFRQICDIPLLWRGLNGPKSTPVLVCGLTLGFCEDICHNFLAVRISPIKRNCRCNVFVLLLPEMLVVSIAHGDKGSTALATSWMNRVSHSYAASSGANSCPCMGTAIQVLSILRQQ